MSFWKKVKKVGKKVLKVLGMCADPRVTHGVGVPGESDALDKVKRGGR